MKLDCRNCPNYAVCKELCPIAARYANQDKVNRREIIIKDKYMETRQAKPETMSTTEIIILLYFIDRTPITKIAESLYISRQYVSRIIKKYKSIIIKNLKK
jgi:DNA-directed RNA polymerase specialized sigma subunit